MIENSVLSAIEQFSLLDTSKNITVALSGGADSVALLYALYRLREKLGITLSAAHLNHMIRGEEALRDELSVHRVPVDVLAVPVLLLLLAEDQPQGIRLVAVRDDQNDVVLLQQTVRRGDRYLPVAPQSGDDEVVVALRGDLVHAFAEDGGIGQVVAGDEDVFFVFGKIG